MFKWIGFIAFLLSTTLPWVASASSELEIPEIQLIFTSRKGTPVPNISAVEQIFYDQWGISCRKGIPWICPGWKSTDLPVLISRASGDDGIALLPQTIATLEGIHRNPELYLKFGFFCAKKRIFSSNHYAFLDSVKCDPDITRDGYLPFKGESEIKAMPNIIRCSFDIEPEELAGLDRFLESDECS